MKVEQKASGFEPIVITLETEQEAIAFAKMVKHVDPAYCDSFDYELWDALPDSITEQL